MSKLLFNSCHRHIFKSLSNSTLLASIVCNFSRLYSKLVLGQTSIMYLIVCTLPHSQFGDSLKPYSLKRYWHLHFFVLIQDLRWSTGILEDWNLGHYNMVFHSLSIFYSRDTLAVSPNSLIKLKKLDKLVCVWQTTIWPIK